MLWDLYMWAGGRFVQCSGGVAAHWLQLKLWQCTSRPGKEQPHAGLQPAYRLPAEHIELFGDKGRDSPLTRWQG